MSILSVIYPLWIGIFLNLALAAVNLLCVSRNGPVIRAYMKCVTPVLLLVWVALIAWTVANWVSQ